MNRLHESLKTYLYETLSMIIEPHSWKNQGNLPFFLIDAYDFFEISLFDQSCLLMIARENADITPGMIRKHWEQVQKNWHGPIIYVQAVLSSYNRKRLIEQHVPFIIPGNQMYLPHFAIDLREHFRKIHSKKQKSFSPGTQTVVIYALLRETDEKLYRNNLKNREFDKEAPQNLCPERETIAGRQGSSEDKNSEEKPTRSKPDSSGYFGITPSALAERLDYTIMTMTRALDELRTAEIGEFHREGRERYWLFSNKQSLWSQAQPFLRSPIKKRVWIKNHQFETLAGLSALAHFSQLAPPVLPVFAIGQNQWEALKQLDLEELPTSEGASSELEIWNYNPELFAKDGVVDPFSLYFSLEAHGDERVESALEEMMENIKW